MSFLQLTPQNIKQARSLSYPEAFKLDRTLGFNPNFKGGVGPAKYIGEGLKSLIGFGDQNIGGATPLTRKLALDATDLFKSGVGFVAKRALPFMSIFTPTELGADDMTPQMMEEIDITDELDDYYEKGEMMDNVVDAPKSGILESINFGKLLSLAEIFGPTNLRKALVGTRLGDTVSNIFQAGRNRSNFQYRTPGYTGQLIASDFYDPITKPNRFDRAKTLFGQSRTLADFLDKRREEKIRELDLEEKRRLASRLPSGGGGDDGGSDPTAPGGPQSMGSAQGGAGGRPY